MDAAESRPDQGATISEERLAVILDYLREHADFRDFAALVDRIRDGDRHAAQEYCAHTLCLGKKDTWRDWPGPESPDAICRCLNSIIARAQAAWAPTSPPAPSRTEARQPQVPLVLLPRSGPEPAAEIVAERHSAVRPNRFATDDTATAPLRRPLNWLPTSCAARWRDLARFSGFNPYWLAPPAIELLDMVSRVLIGEKGWGPSDRLRGQHRELLLSPTRLSKHGQRHDRRTYQRHCKRLIELGLLLELRRVPNGACVVAPAWWEPHYTNDGLAVWREATRRFSLGVNCRSDVAAVPQSCPPDVAPLPHPPVPHPATAKSPDRSKLPRSRLRHSEGRS